jgi:Acetyltransferase (GNAT) family
MFPYVGNVVVDQSYRRKGIALSLMNQALASTKAWGGAFAFCAVHTENEAASDLYLNKLGFRIFRLEKGSDNFFNPDKRSRYILVKEFPVESETETTAVEEKEEEERGREGEDVLADAAIYNDDDDEDDDDDDDDDEVVLDDNEKFSYLKMKQKFELENKEKEKDKVDNEVVGMRDALMWGDDLSRIERIDYSDLLATTESTTQIQAEFDVEVEVADGI